MELSFLFSIPVNKLTDKIIIGNEGAQLSPVQKETIGRVSCIYSQASHSDVTMCPERMCHLRSIFFFFFLAGGEVETNNNRKRRTMDWALEDLGGGWELRPA
jgi:hypothetical protein